MKVNTPTIDKAIDLASKYWSVMFPLNKEGKIGDSNNFRIIKEK